MRNSLLIGLGLAVMAGMFSCKSNHICPSFESAYILDQQIRHQTFSLFDEDTLPREDFIVRKNKYGVIKSVKYRKKKDEMLTVKMETIFPQVDPPDTLLLAEQDLTPEQMAELLNEGEKPVNRYNVDQIYYMRHFGQYLPMPEEPGIRETEQEESLDLEEPTVKKRKKWQFWKKKDRDQQSDSLNTGFEEDLEVEQEQETLNKKELRRQEQQEKAKQAEIEKAKEPAIIDLDDFEKDRGQTTEPADQGLKKSKNAKSDKPKKKKKIGLGFGKKKNKDNSVEVIDDQDQ